MKVLCIAAHPDDEVLGCGGTLARHAAAGNEIYVLVLADGVGARGFVDDDAVERRWDAANTAMTLLAPAHKLTGLLLLALPDNQFDTVPLLSVARGIEGTLEHFPPDIVYTHHGGDLDIDHRITHQAVMTACRPMPGSSVKAIYAFEVPSSTEWASEAEQAFRPNHFVDITATLDKKLAALEAYGEEMRPFPHARSFEAVRALAAWRGASVGLRAAEAFMTLRRIEA